MSASTNPNFIQPDPQMQPPPQQVVPIQSTSLPLIECQSTERPVALLDLDDPTLPVITLGNFLEGTALAAREM